VRAVLRAFEEAGLVTPRGDPQLDGFQLGRAAENITPGDVLSALRGPEDLAKRRFAGDPTLEALSRDIAAELRPLLYERSLADLAGPLGSVHVDPPDRDR
jgi:DNA-binding IscR family transcriptional regulator